MYKHAPMANHWLGTSKNTKNAVKNKRLLNTILQNLAFCISIVGHQAPHKNVKIPKVPSKNNHWVAAVVA